MNLPELVWWFHFEYQVLCVEVVEINLKILYLRESGALPDRVMEYS